MTNSAQLVARRARAACSWLTPRFWSTIALGLALGLTTQVSAETLPTGVSASDGHIQVEIGPIRLVDASAAAPSGSDVLAGLTGSLAPGEDESGGQATRSQLIARVAPRAPQRVGSQAGDESLPKPASAAPAPAPVEALAALTWTDLAPLPMPPSANLAKASFILKAARAARASQHETAVPASVTIAQAILESDWGRSKLASEGKNYFGIKAKEKEGTAGIVWFDTWEVVDGEDVIQNEPFRAYNTMADSFVDHGLFFHENPRYAAALAVAADPKQFAVEINEAGYATDPSYAPKLIEIMDRYNLYAYDLER